MFPYNKNNYNRQPQRAPFAHQSAPNLQGVQYATNYAKRSGCRLKSTKTGARAGIACITAWNVGKRGFLSIVAVPAIEKYHTIVKGGKKGKEIKAPWERWVVSATHKKPDQYSIEKSTVTGFYNATTQKMYIPDFGMVASPNKNYFGTTVFKKN